MGNKKKRIDELEKLILKYQSSYYGGEAEISDDEFDILYDELKSLAPESAVIKKVGSAEENISLHGVDGFPKAKHLIPMGSQDKAANPEEFIKWIDKQEKEDGALTDKKYKLTKKYIVQYKLDGASLELQYEKGKLIKAVTRGDGIKGDEITSNALRMNGVIEKLDKKFTGGVRGEVIMTHAVWKKKYQSKANCRNAANGLMRRKDGEGCEDLTLIVYDASAIDDDNYFSDELHKIKWLEERGFLITQTKTFSSAEEIIEYRDKTAKTRDKLYFDIDGLVIKNIDIDMSDLRKSRPEKQIAFKFELETAFSVLREIEWSESGATYTPIGIIDPVRLAGTTVKRANLNNPDTIRQIGLKIGSTVSVVKRGEIIPKIERLAPVSYTDELKEIVLPDKCNTCGAALIDGGTRLYCPNPQCPKRLLHRLEKWVSVLDIRELGEKLLIQLFENNVRRINQLYSLKTEELSQFERMGEISAAKVIRHIQTKREITLAAFVAGFDLEGIAETTMEKIAAAGFNTLEKLRKASIEDLAAIFSIGEITAAVIIEGLKECAQEMDAVLNTGFITIALPPSEDSQPLRGKSFCFTGELKTMKRSEAEEKIKSLGAQVKTSVVKDLSYLVTNDPQSGSSKNKKANELGVKIIDEDEFIDLISSKKKKIIITKPEQNAAKLPAQGELF